jgi:uncharacterized membrane protein
MIKSASFGVMHLGIAFTVAYALTGSVAIAGAITFVEPVVNTVAHYFFDRAWDRPQARAWRVRWGLERVADAAPGTAGNGARARAVRGAARRLTLGRTAAGSVPKIAACCFPAPSKSS